MIELTAFFLLFLELLSDQSGGFLTEETVEKRSKGQCIRLSVCHVCERDAPSHHQQETLLTLMTVINSHEQPIK